MKWTKNFKKHAASMFQTSTFHHGSYSVMLSCVVIALAILVNLAVSALPASMIHIDISSNKMYTLGDQTEKLVKNLDQDITIYVLAENGKEDDTLMSLLSRYKDLSDHIRVKTVDPVANPTFTAQYDASSLTSGSVIVEAKDRYKTISSSDIYETSYSSYYSSETSFDGEGEITSAIDYVTSASLPVVYYTSGHDESSLSTKANTGLTKNNYEVKELSLLSKGKVPDDCGVLMILAPQKDFSKEEADMIISYLEKGGNAFITTAYTSEELTQFNRILANYGMKTSGSLVFEGDSNSYFQNPMYILPQYGSHDITSDISSSNTLALIMNTQAIETSKVRSSVTQTALLTSSSKAYAKVPENGQFSTAEKEKGDADGPFNLAMLAEESLSDGTTTKVAVFATPYLVEDEIVSNYNVSNVDLMVNTIGYMCEHESSVSIDAKSMSAETITPSAGAVSFQALLFVLVIPAGLLITGIAVWLKRRKK